MAGKQTETGRVTEQYCTENPTLSSLGLARLLKQDNPLLFTSVDDARASVRYYRGAMGTAHRQHRKDKIIPCTVPQPIEIKYKPYQLPKVNNNCLLLYDIHLPFHDKNAVELAIKYGVQHNVNTVLLMGDTIDFYDISRFLRVPDLAHFQDEMEQFWRLIDYINQELPNAQIFWYEGNHEKRWETYMKSHAPEIFHLTDFKIPEMFNLRELGITWIDKCQYIRAGKLNIMHGHEYGGGSSSVNPARWLYLKAKENAIMGHRHQISTHAGKNLNGEITSCWSVGCLCYVHPEYAPLNEWAQGFCHVHIFPDGNFVVKNKSIIGSEWF